MKGKVKVSSLKGKISGAQDDVRRGFAELIIKHGLEDNLKEVIREEQLRKAGVVYIKTVAQIDPNRFMERYLDALRENSDYLTPEEKEEIKAILFKGEK